MTSTATTFRSEDIARLLGLRLSDVMANWPLIRDELGRQGVLDDPTAIATIATVAIECAFRPRSEQGTDAYFAQYDGKLGNNQPGDGKRYRGRGFVQLTFRGNYREYGQRLGLPLEANPDMANDPPVAARILVAYLVRNNVPALARAGDWRGVRVAVNGPKAFGLDQLRRYVGLLQGAPRTSFQGGSPMGGDAAGRPAPAPAPDPAPDASGDWPAYPGEAHKGMGGPNDPDPTVQAWQDILIRAGVITDNPGNRDGWYGNALYEKVLDLQGNTWGWSNADGACGPGTYKRITGRDA